MPPTFYVCPRCNYQTKLKGDIQRHLNRKRHCKNANMLELTPEIIDTVLRDYIYHITEPTNGTKKNTNKINTKKITKINEQTQANIEVETQCENTNISNDILQDNTTINYDLFDDCGNIYIIHTREFISLNKPVYKIGRSANIANRCKQYPKKSRLIGSLFVKNTVLAENDIKNEFNIKFIRKLEYGLEYFEGNIIEMLDEFINIAKKYI